jgi:hypothetical protein
MAAIQAFAHKARFNQGERYDRKTQHPASKGQTNRTGYKEEHP